MGLFDSWRRKKARPKSVKPHEKKKKVPELAMDDSSDLEAITPILAEYDRLVKRREALIVERESLTKKLDGGEIEPTDFRKELMFRIQEAAKVSESIRELTVKLTELGYRGSLQ